jgi:hypothetical protein
MFLLLFLTGGSRLDGGPARLLLLMLASSFQRTVRPPFSLPLFRMAENGCKGTTFFQTDKQFLRFF